MPFSVMVFLPGVMYGIANAVKPVPQTYHTILAPAKEDINLWQIRIVITASVDCFTAKLTRVCFLQTTDFLSVYIN